MKAIVANEYFRHLNLIQSDPKKLVGLYLPRDILPPSEILDFDSRPLDIRIKDQNGRGACNGHAAALCNEYARVMNGQFHVPLSAWFIYSILCKGVDRGSSIMDAFELIQTLGCAPESLVEYGIINPNRISVAARNCAVNYKMIIGSQLKSWPEILTSVALGKAVNLSVCVANNFNDFDAEGVPGVGHGPSNHAVAVMGGIKTSRRWGKLVKMANSWGTGWGQKGFCWLSEAHLQSATWFEGYEVDAIVEDYTDNENPIKVA